MSIRRINAILKKQIKDTLKNKSILIQFIMFPILTVIIANSVSMEDLPSNFFVNLFAIMYIGMAPLTSMSTIISEEKESNTLRVLLMSNVKAHEYLFGTSFYVITLCFLGSILIVLQSDLNSHEKLIFLSLMLIGIIVSTLIGAVIGLISKNQMSATSISVPAMMIFSFMPMLSMFNDKIAKISKYLYSQQISDAVNAISEFRYDIDHMAIVIINAIVALLLFGLLYKKRGLDS